MTERLGAGGGEECKCFSPPSAPKTNAASPRVLLGSLVSNTSITATPRRRKLTEDLASAGAIRSAETVKRARFIIFAQWKEECLHKAHQGRTRRGSFLQHLDTACSTGEHVVILYMESDVVHSLLFLGC